MRREVWWILFVCQKYNYEKLRYNKYYFNKNGSGIDNLGFYPIIENNNYNYDLIVEPKASALNFKDIMINLDIFNVNQSSFSRI